jgi:DNA-binding PadR family transcriptional regulator
MSIATQLKRRAERPVPLLDAPPLGHLQAIIMRRFDDLGTEAYGFNVLEGLSLEYGVWIDQSQIYNAIRRLVADELIELAETRHQAGTPPLKIYHLTAAGRAALDATAAHHKAVAAFLDNNKRKATRT